jgi:hypothetical protein
MRVARLGQRIAVLVGGVGLLSAAPAALAVTINHGDYVGINIKFTNVRETTQTTGDPDELFGAPTLSGDSLLFFPSAFSASALGAGGEDSTASQLQILLEAKPNEFIDTIKLTEFGDTVLSGLGTAATNTAVNISGAVTVMEDANGVIVPVIIPFLGTFNPKNTFALPGDEEATVWSGSIFIDVASVVPNATVAMFSLDNQLDAFSEDGTSALIQKKVVSGPSVALEVIPEPSTVFLLGGGLLALAFGRRRVAR